MDTENPSIISHVSLGTNNFERARAFYNAVMTALNCRIFMEHPGAVAYGKAFPEFWLQAPHDGGRATAGNGVHVGFNASSRQQVDAFHKAAIKAGGTDDGAPGQRKEYGEPYYGCFVRDLDGNKIEATYWDMSLAKELGMG